MENYAAYAPWVVMAFNGLIAGWLASLLLGGGGVIRDIFVGIIGAFVGGWLLNRLGVSVGVGIVNVIATATIGAVALRHYLAPAQPVAAERPRTAAARIERLAAPLPPADAEKLRAAFRARETSAEGGREALNRAFERIQATLRAEPFDAAQLRAAFAEARVARPVYETAMQEIVTAAATGMSPEGRGKLADWPSSRTNANTR